MNALDTVNQTRDAITVRRVYGDPHQEDGVTKDGDARWRPALDLNRTIFMGQLVAIVMFPSLRSILTAWAKRR